MTNQKIEEQRVDLNPCPSCGSTEKVYLLTDDTVLCEECSYCLDSIEEWNAAPQPKDIKPCPICKAKASWSPAGCFICDNEKCALHEELFEELEVWNSFPREDGLTEIGELGCRVLYKGLPCKVVDWTHSRNDGKFYAAVELAEVSPTDKNQDTEE